jgi:hypothetical protein
MTIENLVPPQVQKSSSLIQTNPDVIESYSPNAGVTSDFAEHSDNVDPLPDYFQGFCAIEGILHPYHTAV